MKRKKTLQNGLRVAVSKVYKVNCDVDGMLGVLLALLVGDILNDQLVAM